MMGGSGGGGSGGGGAAGGYDFSFADSKSTASSLANPFSATDQSFNSGAGRLISGITTMEIVIVAATALAAVFLYLRFR